MQRPAPEARLQHLSQGKKRKPFNIIHFALRRGGIVVVVGLLCSLPLMMILLPRAQPVYEADALLLIDPTHEPTLGGRERNPIPGNLGDWTRTQIARITAADVLRDAMSRVPVEDWPNFLREQPDHPANAFRLMRRIRVREVSRTHLVTLHIRNDDPEGIAEMLNATMEAFIEKLQREFELTYARRLEYLLQERERIAARLEAEEATLLALAENVENKAFLHQGYMAHLSKVEQIQRLYWEAYVMNAEAQARLQQARQDQQQLLGMSLQPFADARVADNFGINRIELWTYEQLQIMRSGIDGLTPENTDRIYVETRMRAMEEYLVEYKRRVNEETIRNLVEQREHELQAAVFLAESAADAAARTVSLLEQRLREARAEAEAVSLAIFRASTPSFTRDQLRDRLQALNSRIDDTEMEAKTPIRLYIDKRADPPTSPSSSSILTLLILSLGLGFAPIGFVVLVYEIADNRLRTAREVELALGGPGPDPITAYTSRVSQQDHLATALLEEPHHPASTALRELGARIAHDHRVAGGQIYAVLGLQPQAGATAVSVNLAQAVATLSGNVLLLELNLERPGLAAMLEMPPAGGGIQSWFRNPGELSDLIQHDARRQIDVLSADGTGRPERLASLPDLLEQLRQRYAVILVDAGAFPADLSLHVGRLSDGVVLIARYKETCYRSLRLAIDRLTQAGVPALTAVLNDARGREVPFAITALESTILWISKKMDLILHRPKPRKDPS